MGSIHHFLLWFSSKIDYSIQNYKFPNALEPEPKKNFFFPT